MTAEEAIEKIREILYTERNAMRALVKILKVIGEDTESVIRKWESEEQA